MRTNFARASRVGLLGLLVASLVGGVALAAAGGTFPAGVYDAGQDLTMDFASNGHFVLAQKGQTLVAGIYGTKGNEISLTDESGPEACTGADMVTGTYSWKLDGKALKLTKISDKCDDRATDIANATFQKK